jgi:hypothetical protein
MTSGEPFAKDFTGYKLEPGNIVALLEQEKPKIAIIEGIQYRQIEYCGKEKYYPVLKLLIVSSKWDKHLQRFAAYLSPIKTTHYKKLVYMEGYLERLQKNLDSEVEQDIFSLLTEVTKKTKKLKLVS